MLLRECIRTYCKRSQCIINILQKSQPCVTSYLDTHALYTSHTDLFYMDTGVKYYQIMRITQKSKRSCRREGEPHAEGSIVLE